MTRQVQDAYIVAATRSPVGKAPRGMFKNVRPDDLLALKRAATSDGPGLIDGVIVGRALYDGRIDPASALQLLSASAADADGFGIVH